MLVHLCSKKPNQMESFDGRALWTLSNIGVTIVCTDVFCTMAPFFFLDANKALITFILFTSLMMNGTFPKFKTCLLRIYSAGNYVIGWRFYLIWHFVIKSLSAQINMTNDMKVNIHYIRSLSICPAETGKSMLSTRIFFKKSSKFDVTQINGDKNVLDAQIILKSLDALSNSPNFDLIGVHLSC